MFSIIQQILPLCFLIYQSSNHSASVKPLSCGVITIRNSENTVPKTTNYLWRMWTTKSSTPSNLPEILKVLQQRQPFTFIFQQLTALLDENYQDPGWFCFHYEPFQETVPHAFHLLQVLQEIQYIYKC